MTQNEFDAAWREKGELSDKISEARQNLRKWEARRDELHALCLAAMKAQHEREAAG